MSQAPEWVRVASIGGAHGVRGELKVSMLGGDQGRLQPGDHLRVGPRSLTVEEVRGTDQQLLVRLVGVSDRESAAALTGEYLEVPVASVRPLPEGEYFHFQLVGMEVLDAKGAPRGKVVDVEPYPAHDVYVVRTPVAELRIPAVREAVLEIDLQRSRMTIADPFLEDWTDAN